MQCFGVGGENRLSCVESSSLYSLFFEELLIYIDVSNNANNFRLCRMKLNLWRSTYMHDLEALLQNEMVFCAAILCHLPPLTVYLAVTVRIQ